MSIKLLHVIALGLFVGLSSAEAQTFAPGGNVASGNGGYIRPSAPNFQKANPAKLTPELQAAPSTSEDGDLLESAETKIEKPVPAEEYDNSIGKVIQFKFVNGKMVFAADDDRKILVSYEDYKVERGMDNMVRCTMRIFVLNDMKERLSNLSFKLKWPEISTSVQMVKVNPGVKTYVDTMLLGNGCLSMDKTPTIEVNRCRIKGKTEEQCADAVKWFQKNQ